MWTYLREKVKMAFLGGVQDALAELDGSGENGAAEAVALLRARLQPALPAPEPEGELSGRRKGRAS